MSGVDTAVVDKVSQEGYFTKDKAQKKKGEEAFFKQGEKAEVCDFERDLRCGERVLILL